MQSRDGESCNAVAAFIEHARLAQILERHLIMFIPVTRDGLGSLQTSALQVNRSMLSNYTRSQALAGRCPKPLSLLRAILYPVIQASYRGDELAEC